MNLRLLLAKYALGMLPSDDLPGIATDLLVDGFESQSLACLAGSARCDSSVERRELFEAGLEECAVVVPGQLEAAHELKIHFAGQVAQQKLDPAQGAAEIDDIATDDPRCADIDRDIVRECLRIAEPRTA